MGAFFYLLSAKDENKKKRVDFFFETIVKQYLERNGHNLNKSKTIILTKNDDINDSNGIQESNNCCIGGGKSNKKRNNLNIIFLGEKGVRKTTIIKIILGDNINIKYEQTKCYKKWIYM